MGPTSSQPRHHLITRGWELETPPPDFPDTPSRPPQTAGRRRRGSRENPSSLTGRGLDVRPWPREGSGRRKVCKHVTQSCALLDYWLSPAGVRTPWLDQVPDIEALERPTEVLV